MDLETPSRTSVCKVRSILSSFDIPTELVLYIMDIAEYYPTLRTERTDDVTIAAGWHHDTEAYWAAKLYLVSKALPRSPDDLFWGVRKVSWELEGHDQGWADECRGTDHHTQQSLHDGRSPDSNFKASTSRPAPGTTHASSDLFKPTGSRTS